MPVTRPIRRALLSVHDKTGLIEFARGLKAMGVELISTGGSARVLREAGLAVREVSELTGLPEMFGGRVKTLHPNIHAGILARRGADEAELAARGIGAINLVAVNLYPFESVAARTGTKEVEVIEMIDIGGPAMIRAAAKNWRDVAVVCDPADYPKLLECLAHGGGVPEEERRRLAAKAFARTAAYDTAIADWFAAQAERERESAEFPHVLTPRFERILTFRYGENPHQRAALYAEPGSAAGGVMAARQLQGQSLSFNNLADADAAWRLVNAFATPTCVIVKHLIPCGVATAPTPRAAYDAAYACDPASAFGGVLAFNRTLDADTARTVLGRQFAEVIVAPQVSEEARAPLAAKPRLRLLAAADYASVTGGPEYRSIAGGLLVQNADPLRALAPAARVVTRRKPAAAERDDLDFAWRVVQAVRSNAIVIARAQATLGIGAGQTSRVAAVRIAGMKAAEAGLDLAASVLASDAFFPFRDNVDVAAALGVRAIVQPGGSRRDGEVIAAADAHDIAMIFTGERHFRH